MDKEYISDSAGRKIQFELVRSRRKTVGITISKEGGIKVSAPISATKKQVMEIVTNKTSWILKKLEEIKKASGELKKDRRFIDGEIFLYRGLEYVLRIQRKRGLEKPEVVLCSKDIYVVVHEEAVSVEQVCLIRDALRIWYIKQFEATLRERVMKYAALVGVNPARITIREQKTRWGSCSAKGNMNFNWKLVMAPPEVLDYVVVHELCHLKHMNHSQKFWNAVEEVLPSFSENRKWLKTNCGRLYF